MPAPTACNINFSAAFGGLYEATGDPYTTKTSQQVRAAFSYDFTIGTSDNQGNRVYVGSGTVDSTGSNIDLYGSLIDLLGNTLNILDIAGIAFENLNSTDGQYLLVGGAASNTFTSLFADATDKIKVYASGVAIFIAPLATGYGLTSSTDQLKLAAGGAYNVSYRIFILGRTA